MFLVELSTMVHAMLLMLAGVFIVVRCSSRVTAQSRTPNALSEIILEPEDQMEPPVEEEEEKGDSLPPSPESPPSYTTLKH